MMLDDPDQLHEHTDEQLWEAAADTRNPVEIRQEAIQRWLFPDETNPDADPNELGGGRLHELRRRATVLDEDELADDDIEDVQGIAPYFDGQGRLILEHDDVHYLIDSLDDEGAYDGANNRQDEITTDEKTNLDRDI